MALVDYPKFVLELKDRMTSEPDLRITGHHIYNDLKAKFLGVDFSLTNISTSSFSLSALRLNKAECLLKPTIEKPDLGGGRHIQLFDTEISFRESPRYVPGDSGLPFIDALPVSLYLEPRESLRGLSFWDGEFAPGNEIEISTTILSINREIRASMRIPA